MSTPVFDVFLCHNSEDKPSLRIIAEKLRQQNLNPWFDESSLQPGLRWQQVLQQEIEQINAAAVFIGRNGLGPWQEQEIEAFLQVFAQNNKPLIPVLLPDAPQKPKIPLFLQGRTWVDFRQPHPEPLGRLIWGITGKKPTYENHSVEFSDSGLKDPGISISESNNSLEQLEVFLSARKWKEADEKTKEIILYEAQTEKLTVPHIREIPTELLDSVDQLWAKYSDGRFGLRIQNKIWKHSLEPERSRFISFFAQVDPPTESQAWNKFGRSVGWRGNDDKLLRLSKTDYSLKANLGCFPITRQWLHGGYGNSVKQFAALMEQVAQLDS